MINPQLAHHPREVNPLALTAAKRLIFTITEFRYLEVRHDFIDNLFVCWSGTVTKVRVTSHHHHFTNRERKGNLDCLRENGAMLCELGFANLCNVDTVIL